MRGSVHVVLPIHKPDPEFFHDSKLCSSRDQTTPVITIKENAFPVCNPPVRTCAGILGESFLLRSNLQKFENMHFHKGMLAKLC